MGTQKKKVIYHGKEFIIELINDHQIKIDGYVFTPEVLQQTETRFKVSFGKYHFSMENIDGKLFLEGEEVDIDIKPYIGVKNTKLSNQNPTNIIIKAPIPGKILQILVKPDECIEQDQEILILEAMKMRNRIFSPINGVVSNIFVEIGQNVTQDQQLASITSNNVTKE